MSDLVVSVVYVSWRDTDMLARSLERLASVAGTDGAQVIVVVNEAGVGAADKVAAAWPGAMVIPNAGNRGFGPACNQGAAAAEGDVLLFLNPDTLAGEGAIEEIRRAFAECPEAVAVAPCLVDAGPAGDEDQRTFQLRRLPRLASDARELLLIDRVVPGNPGRRRDRYLDTDRDVPFPIEQAAAAALAVRRSAFESVGGFDERFVPAYWEDVDLCRRLGGRGEIVFWPEAKIEHLGGFAARELGRRSFLEMYHRNALRYRAKHYSRAGHAAYRALLIMGMGLRALAAVITRAPGRGDRDDIGGYLSVAGMALRGRQGEHG